MFSVLSDVLFDHGRRMECLWNIKQDHVQGRFFQYTKSEPFLLKLI